ncbi:Elongation factor 1-gamma [Halotydeus destructor]|nr:Elongation factor 1-gamma [Halotydeus destructor]
MAQGTIYSYAESFRTQKALIAAQYSGAKVDVAKDFTFGVTEKSEKFTSKFPLGKVPAFEASTGQVLFESNAIAFYVANEQLRGKTPLDQAQIIQWLSFSDNDIVPAVLGCVFPTLNILSLTKQHIERTQHDLNRALLVLNTQLLTKTFLVGERITLADIVVACSLLPAYQFVLDPKARGDYANVNRWFTTLVNQAQFKAVLGEIHLCDDVSAAVEALAHAKPSRGAEKHKKEKEKKKEAKKAEPKKPKTPEPAEELDECDLLTQEKPTKDPFEAFPKGNFNMDEFKRTFSNKSDEEAIAYFFEKFDKENYSIWFCDYKYPEELTLVFMTCNLMSGMMQRLDKMRKNAFGNMLLFGEDKNNTIAGLWFWRGHELAFELSDDWKVDYDSYNWRKLDFGSDEVKQLVKQYFTYEGEFKGLKFNQGKCFK